MTSNVNTPSEDTSSSDSFDYAADIARIEALMLTLGDDGLLQDRTICSNVRGILDADDFIISPENGFIYYVDEVGKRIQIYGAMQDGTYKLTDEFVAKLKDKLGSVTEFFRNKSNRAVSRVVPEHIDAAANNPQIGYTVGSWKVADVKDGGVVVFDYKNQRTETFTAWDWAQFVFTNRTLVRAEAEPFSCLALGSPVFYSELPTFNRAHATSNTFKLWGV